MSMDYGAALSAIEASGVANVADIVAAIKGQVGAVLNEKRAVQGAASAVTANADAILTALGAIGDDSGSRFADALVKFQALQTSAAGAAASVKTLSEANQQLLTQVATLGRKATLAQVVAGTGASEAVLEVLIPDHSAVMIADGAVMIGGVAWEEWIKVPAVVPFVPALLPNGTKPPGAAGGKLDQKSDPKMPTNAAGGQQPTVSLYDRVRGLGGAAAPAAQPAPTGQRSLSPFMR